MIQPKPDLILNNVFDTDSYKASHYLLYPEGMSNMFSYMESRGGEFETAALFGLQMILHKAITKSVTLGDVRSMAAFCEAHGEPFNSAGFSGMLRETGGFLPVRIRAVPEGLSLPVSTPLLTVEYTGSWKCAWIVNWLETQLSRVWYPSTILTTSKEIKKVWQRYLDLSSDDPAAEIGFKHHDFGARGVTCPEQAQIGGAAHLVSFLGSDTIAGIMAANHYYDCPMAGFSIPATEHSTMTIFGKGGERAALIIWIQKTLIDREVPPGVPKLSACVGDSYDIFNFAHTVCHPDVLRLISGSGGTLIVRPDSGNPNYVLRQILNIFESNLPYGAVTKNTKGYKVLPPYLRIIWGDGINRRSQPKILEHLTNLGWSASNLAMGSGGGLLMDVNRDTQKFAFKCSEVVVDGVSIDVRKDPVTDPGKRSKAGRLDVIEHPDGQYETVVLDPGQIAHERSIMSTVFENGEIKKHYTFDEVRANAAR